MAARISGLSSVVTDLPITRRRTSPIPIGLIPGFLSKGMRRQEIKAARGSGSTSSSCTQIEKGTCNGLVFSTTGGMGPQATMFLKRVATLLAAKTGQDKSLVMANLRRRLRFELLKTVLIAVRGHRGRYYQKAIPVDELDLNLVHTTNDEDNGDDVDDVDDDNDEDDEDVEDVEDVEDEDVEDEDVEE